MKIGYYALCVWCAFLDTLRMKMYRCTKFRVDSLSQDGYDMTINTTTADTIYLECVMRFLVPVPFWVCFGGKCT